MTRAVTTTKRPARKPAAKPPKISAGLRKFLAEWLEWAEAGGEGSQFSSFLGLCSNAPVAVDIELDRLLKATVGDSSYPFGGLERYYNNCGTIHTNPLRLAWVRRMLGKRPRKAATRKAGGQ